MKPRKISTEHRAWCASNNTTTAACNCGAGASTYVSPKWRGVYADLREADCPRWRALLLSTGLWVLRPFCWLFPEEEV